jgi:hypothetical protein
MFANQSPGALEDPLLLIDPPPVECARGRETIKRSPRGDVVGCRWCTSSPTGLCVTLNPVVTSHSHKSRLGAATATGPVNCVIGGVA